MSESRTIRVTVRGSFDNLTDEQKAELTANLTQHIWVFSRAAERKYRCVTWAIWLLAGAMLVGVAGLLLP